MRVLIALVAITAVAHADEPNWVELFQREYRHRSAQIKISEVAPSGLLPQCRPLGRLPKLEPYAVSVDTRFADENVFFRTLQIQIESTGLVVVPEVVESACGGSDIWLDTVANKQRAANP